MAKSLDEQVEAFRTRPLDQGPYSYVWVDALAIKSREVKGRKGKLHVASVATLVATAVNADGRREILHLDVVTTEDGAGWLQFFPQMVSRGLSGVELVISDSIALHGRSEVLGVELVNAVSQLLGAAGHGGTPFEQFADLGLDGIHR